MVPCVIFGKIVHRLNLVIRSLGDSSHAYIHTVCDKPGDVYMFQCVQHVLDNSKTPINSSWEFCFYLPFIASIAVHQKVSLSNSKAFYVNHSSIQMFPWCVCYWTASW